MSIYTTIYIKSNLLTKIQNVSSSYDIPMNKIIMLLMNKMLKNTDSSPSLFKSVQYQKDNDAVNWHRLHVSFSNYSYELALDLRKVLKLSVSYIISLAIVEYLDEIVESLCIKKKDIDNYLQNYVFISNDYNGVHYFTTFWGYPSEKILNKHLD